MNGVHHRGESQNGIDREHHGCWHLLASTRPSKPHGTPYFPSASFHAISAMEACSLELRHEHGEACLEEWEEMKIDDRTQCHR